MRLPRRYAPFPSVVLLLCCAWLGISDAAEKSSSYRAALESIKAEELAEQVGELADPAMEGREAGTRGGHAAGEYLAEQYARLHLQPAGEDDTRFQVFAPNFRNVLSILPGSDPKLRDQVIVIGAHYDHIGYGENRLSLGQPGHIHPGADDNASGTSAVLELAKAFTVLAVAPKRSILFAAWDAEEKGLLGTKYWVAHPTIPLERVAAVVNLDMVGRLRGKRLFVFGSRTGYGWRRLLSCQNDAGGPLLDFSWSFKPNADYYPFFEQEIPVLMFNTGLHDNYHRPSDVAGTINADGMRDVARLLFAVVHELADRPTGVPGFRAEASMESPETEREILDQIAKPTDRLGVGWSDDAATAGGIRVTRVEPDSPADQAGIATDDCIKTFAGRKIATDDDFYAAVSAAENPASLTVGRPGNEKPLTLKVTLLGNPMRWGIVWHVDDAEPGAVILTHVTPSSPAARAGLKLGDRIYQVAGRDFADESAFLALLKPHLDALPLLIERDGRPRSVILRRQHAEPIKRAA